MSRYPQLCDAQGRIETDVMNGKPTHLSEVERIVDLAHSHNPAERWQRESVREWMEKSIPPAIDSPLRQASSQMEYNGLLYCSGCKEYHPKSAFSKVKFTKYRDASVGYSRAALYKRGYRYWCKDYEAAHAKQRYYSRLGEKAEQIAQSA